ncbi:general substrate transporter [Leucosporidium creatinivorum]|uniref:General substrate transporter n=1 Tax=Leucosporidium creatinivorum TaxID=106004 RepID=A0A1Y2ESG1_9BASI|nr:general substrate transporter [Leucosporidium creatinivorum]
MSNVPGAFAHIPNDLTTGGGKWWKNAGVLKLNFFISVVYVAQALNGYDSSLIGGFQALPSWKAALGNPSRSAIGIMNASFYIAGLLTAPIASYVSDRWGRKWCIRYSALAALLGTILGSIAGVDGADGYGLFTASRVIFGSGISFSLMISPIMLQELPHPSQRVVIAGLFNANYAVGAFLAAWVAFGCSYISNAYAFKIPYILQAPMALYCLIAIQFVPETPRWLMSKGREEEAMAFLVKYHGNGDPQDELVLFEFQEMKEAIREEKERHQDSWSQLFATKGNRHRLAIVFLIVSCQNFSGTAIISVYYTQILTLVGITGAQKQTGINAGLTAFTCVAAIIGATFVNRLRRRTMLMGSWAALILVNVGFVVSAARYVQTGATSAAYTNVVMLWLYDFCFFFVCGPLFFSYQTECLSYSVRAKGMMIWGITAKVISVFNSYVNSIAIGAIGWKYYLVYTCTLTLQLVCMYLVAVETSGYTLEEIAVLFDGENSTAPHVEVAQYEQSTHEKKKVGDAQVVDVSATSSKV